MMSALVKSGHPPKFGKLRLNAHGIDRGKEGRRIDTVHRNWLTFGRIGICHCGSHGSLLSLIGRFRKSGHCLFSEFWLRELSRPLPKARPRKVLLQNLPSLFMRDLGQFRRGRFVEIVH
jgi:hypothetical protein